MLVVFSPDGIRIASRSYDKTIHLWNAVSGVCINTCSNNSGSASIAQFSLNDDGARREQLLVSDIVKTAHLKLIYTLFASRSLTESAILPGGRVYLSS